MPVVVGSLLVLSANPLAVFFLRAKYAFFAICTQNLQWLTQRQWLR